MLEQLRGRGEPSIINTEKYIAELKSKGLLPRKDLPSRAVLLYSPSVIHSFRKKYPCDRQPFFTGEIDFVPISAVCTKDSDQSSKGEIAIVSRLGFGGPSMALFVEKLFALGVREFLIVGTAGSLDPALQIGSFVLPFTALRDDGISDHYLPKSQNVQASMQIVTRLKATFADAGMPYAEKAVWTTDSFYRETQSGVIAAQKMGASVVDMEAAGLFAMCEYHRCKGAALLVVSDHVGMHDWVPQFSEVGEQLLQGLELGVKALAKA
jgi:uridine phosphorylase